MSYLGDFRLGDTFDTKFCTVATTGAPTTLAGSPVISAYPGNSTTQLTAGITLSVDFDSVTGLHNVRVVASNGNGYATATNYQLVITTGTVGGTSVVGYVVAEFSIENRSALMPTTAARTLDVSAGGEAGVDWANVGSPTTSLNLSATTIATTQKVDVDTIKTNPVANGGTITFPSNATLASTTNITAGMVTTATNVTTVNGLAAGVITASSIAADAITAAKIADGAIDAATFAASAITATVIAADAIGSSQLAATAVNEIADQVWDEQLSGHTTAGSAGKALSDAGAAADPWGTSLPGAYGAGTAGFIVGTNLDAQVSTRLATAGYTAPLTAATTRSAVGLASANLDTQLASIQTDTTAISAKTSNLPEGIKKNTALSAFEFYMALSADHVSPGTGLTITATRSIDGGAFASCTNSATEVANGIYKINLSAADLNGSVITLQFAAATADTTMITIKTSL